MAENVGTYLLNGHSKHLSNFPDPLNWHPSPLIDRSALDPTGFGNPHRQAARLVDLGDDLVGFLRACHEQKEITGFANNQLTGGEAIAT